MIKIIKGYYGYKNGNSIIPKCSKDAPFSCDKAEEARLVKLGVAEYVKAEANEGDGDDESNDDESNDDESNDAPSFDEVDGVVE